MKIITTEARVEIYPFCEPSEPHEGRSVITVTQGINPRVSASIVFGQADNLHIHELRDALDEALKLARRDSRG